MLKHQQDRLWHFWISSSFVFRELFWVFKISTHFIMEKAAPVSVDFLRHCITQRSQHHFPCGIKTFISFPFNTSARHWDFSFCGEWHVEQHGIKWYFKCQPSIEKKTNQSKPKPKNPTTNPQTQILLILFRSNKTTFNMCLTCRQRSVAHMGWPHHLIPKLSASRTRTVSAACYSVTGGIRAQTEKSFKKII